MVKDVVQPLERGVVYFLYRPKVGEFAPTGLEDVQRFYMILHPEGKKLYRLIVVAEKRLPESQGDGKKYWGYVESIATSATQVEEEFKGRVYATKTVGERGQPSGRPAGEGMYEIFKHKDHTHLVYQLTLPEKLGQVQMELGIRPEGNFIISLINPKVTPPEDVVFKQYQKAHYPEKLQKLFDKRRFLKIEKSEFLNYSGSAFLLIGINREVSKDIGIDIEPSLENGASAKVFDDLKLEKATHRIEPLFRGRWA